MKSVNILGVRVDCLGYQEVQDKILEYLRNEASHFVLTANAEMFFKAYKNKAYDDILNQSEMIYHQHLQNIDKPDLL